MKMRRKKNPIKLINKALYVTDDHHRRFYALASEYEASSELMEKMLNFAELTKKGKKKCQITNQKSAE